MRNVSHVLTSVVAALVLTSAAEPARADPVLLDPAGVITSGAYVVKSGTDTFRLAGSWFSLIQDSGADPAKVFATTCVTCAAGDTVNLSFRNPPLTPEGYVMYVDLGSGRGTIGGTTYPFLSFSGSLKFNVAPVVFPDTDDAIVQIASPFSFRGWFQAGPNPGPFLGGTEFRLRGLGTASTWFIRDGDVFRPSGDTTFEFNTVTPEPGSLLLLGTGLAAFGRTGWRRIRRR